MQTQSQLNTMHYLTLVLRTFIPPWIQTSFDPFMNMIYPSMHPSISPDPSVLKNPHSRKKMRCVGLFHYSICFVSYMCHKTAFYPYQSENFFNWCYFSVCGTARFEARWTSPTSRRVALSRLKCISAPSQRSSIYEVAPHWNRLSQGGGGAHVQVPEK